jgi:hypothetical protein
MHRISLLASSQPVGSGANQGFEGGAIHSVVRRVSTSTPIRATLRDRESAALITQDEDHRCGSSEPAHEPSNSDTTPRERGESQYERMGLRCTCRSTTSALRMLPVLPRQFRCLDRSRQTLGDRVSAHARTCFRQHHRKVVPRHARPTDSAFDQTVCVPRTIRAATCQPN